KEVRILLEHTTKDGAPRIKEKCSYPLTAQACVKRIYTNLAVIDVAPNGLVVHEMVEGLDLVGLQKVTEPKLTLANDWKKLTAPAV
ncbi:MAG: CoA-transferase, partial [Stellaceae bacterium]